MEIKQAAKQGNKEVLCCYFVVISNMKTLCHDITRAETTIDGSWRGM